MYRQGLCREDALGHAPVGPATTQLAQYHDSQRRQARQIRLVVDPRRTDRRLADVDDRRHLGNA